MRRAGLALSMRIGIDAGGTFTDFAVWRQGRLETFKLRSDPQNPARVILEGIRRAVGRYGKAEIIHGSTVATNALLERKGAVTAFVTTAGFEDLLLIGRQNRAALYDLAPLPRRHLIPARLCFGVAERTWASGEIARRPSVRALEKLKRRLRAEAVESVAICLLHSYCNPENERMVAQALAGAGYISASCEVSPEFREYERAATTAVNAYVGPLMERYLARLENGSPFPIWVLQSNGGLLSSGEARRHAVRTVLSGPAGGVVGVFHAARRSGFTRVIGLDMGGTSTDVSLCDVKPHETVESSVDGIPIRVPMLDIHTVGAGGGSIARVDAGGLLRVGPESAGADPGPACYGVGELPTVTDAHVVLGRIAENQLLGGAMRLDVGRAQAAFQRLGAGLHWDAARTAQGVLRVANANMERAIRAISIERGHDPRQFALAAFGGCGGLHACELAHELGIRTVLVPPDAGVLSAVGMLLAPRARDYAAGVLGAARPVEVFRSLEQKARSENPKAKLTRYADVRYAGQSYELTIPWAGARTAQAFHRAHQRVYGYADPQRDVEFVTLRVRATTAVAKPRFTPRPPAGGSPVDWRRVFVSGRWRRVPVWKREDLPARTLGGPLLVLDYGATTLVPGGWRLQRDQWGMLILEAR